MWQLLAELEQCHSSVRYLDTTAADTDSSTSQRPQQHVETHTDICADSVESKADQLDAVTSTSTQDGHADKLGESSTACLPTFDSSRMTFDSECRDCRLRCKNLQPDNLVMYLHAYCYQVRFCHGKYTYSMRYKVRLHIICLIVTLLKCLNDSDMRYPDHCVWLGCLQSLPLQATQFSGLFLDMRLFYC